MARDEHEERVAVFAVGRDGPLTREVLAGAGFAAELPRTVGELCGAIRRGVGAVVLGEEVLARPAIDLLAGELAAQPAWSDLPVLVVTRGERVGRALGPLDVLRNVAVLSRPMSMDGFVTAVRAAIRARRRQYQVRELLRERTEADRRKDEFLAMLAHELRNPLAPIRNAVHLMGLDGLDREKLSNMRAIAERQVEHMSRLVDDLMDVSRITRGKVELRERSFDLRRAAKEAARSVAPTMEAKGHRLVVDLPDSAAMIRADPTRIEQVIVNILGNAAKYTDPGGTIVLAVTRDRSGVVLSIKDDGVGIDRHDLPKVFDLFAQADRPIDRTQGGLGIGLTVVRRLVELHGGGVEARSDGPGTGTEIVVRLPLVEGTDAEDDVAETRSSSGGRAVRVLLVEDNEDGARTLAAILELHGHRVRVAGDGLTALEVAREFAPEVVLADIGLPGIDGYELARRLRLEPGMEEVKLIAVTGYGQPEDESKAEAAGFDRHLTKPIDVALLIGSFEVMPVGDDGG